MEDYFRMDPMQQMYKSSNNSRQSTNAVYIDIIEQPASNAHRFRFASEGRLIRSIPGVNSTTENKTFPAIRIVGYRGRVVVVVSCVTKDEPYRPHPYDLITRKPNSSKKGICFIEITDNESMIATFQYLGIQCVTKKNIKEALEVREKIRVDPFGTGFSHKYNPDSIDTDAVRLCFQAFIKDSQNGDYIILKPVVSEIIYDRNAIKL